MNRDVCELDGFAVHCVVSVYLSIIFGITYLLLYCYFITIIILGFLICFIKNKRFNTRRSNNMFWW